MRRTMRQAWPSLRRLPLRLCKVRAVSFNYARTERRFFDKELEADFRALEAAAPGGAEVSIASRTRDEQTWLVAPRSARPPRLSPPLSPYLAAQRGRRA